MSILKIVAVILACLSFCFTFAERALGQGVSIEDSKIVGGYPINITDAPYQVSVQLGGSMVCGGAILAPRFVVTAGHCILRTTSYYSIRAGATDHILEGTIHSAVNITVHPLYDDILYDYDIAIIEIDPPFTYDDVHQPITIADATVNEGYVNITGWGTTQQDGETSRVLQSVEVPVVKYKECDTLYAEFGGLSSRMMCSGSAGHDSCQGDSGGPVVQNGVLVGTVSWANGCALEGYPGVNANVAHVEIRQFIRDVLNK